MVSHLESNLSKRWWWTGNRLWTRQMFDLDDLHTYYIANRQYGDVLNVNYFHVLGTTYDFYLDSRGGENGQAEEECVWVHLMWVWYVFCDCCGMMDFITLPPGWCEFGYFPCARLVDNICYAEVGWFLCGISLGELIALNEYQSRGCSLLVLI